MQDNVQDYNYEPRNRGIHSRDLDSSDDEFDANGNEIRTETFTEVSPKFKRNCKAGATAIVLCVFLLVVFVPAMMGATNDLSVDCLDDKIQNSFQR